MHVGHRESPAGSKVTHSRTPLNSHPVAHFSIDSIDSKIQFIAPFALEKDLHFSTECLGKHLRCTQPRQGRDKHSVGIEEVRSLLYPKFS